MNNYIVTIAERGEAVRTINVIAKDSVSAVRTGLATMRNTGKISVVMA